MLEAKKYEVQAYLPHLRVEEKDYVIFKRYLSKSRQNVQIKAV